MHSSPNGPVSETRLEDLSELSTHGQTTIWIDVVDPTPDEIARIGDVDPDRGVLVGNDLVEVFEARIGDRTIWASMKNELDHG